MKLTHLEVYFTKRLNAFIAKSFHWFWEYVVPLYPDISPTAVCYNFINCFLELKIVKKLLQN